MERIEAPWRIAEMPKETSVLLGLSGGADSRFLLHVLAEYAKRDGFSLTLAHVNHGIRGGDALRDRDFCVSLAQEYGFDIFVLDADVPSLAKEHGTGLEEEARTVRYDYFSSLMREKGIPILVTAHNADDNVETVLFHMARGCGLGGLGGIAPVRPFADGVLVRPMLQVTKREILSYCLENGLRFVTDATNDDTTYARNKIRAEVLPALESLFAGATERISSMAEQLRADEAILSDLTADFLNRFCKDGNCPIKPLLEQADGMQGRILAAWYEERCQKSLARVHIDDMLQLCRSAVPHSALSLPGGVGVAVEKEALCIRDKESQTPVDYHLPFCMGETKILGGRISVLVENHQKNLKVHNLSTAPYINLRTVSDIMEKELYWRPRKEGDRILMGGIHRSVRRLYREAGLSLALRACLPILCDAQGIVWIPFVGCRDGMKCETNEDGVRIMLSVQKEF